VKNVETWAKKADTGANANQPGYWRSTAFCIGHAYWIKEPYG